MERDRERIDPEAEGIPSIADDQSTAYDEPEPRMRPDGQPPLPVDRPDHGTKSESGGVGRLEEQDDEGTAFDTGETSGLSAEEAAMHVESEYAGSEYAESEEEQEL